MHHPSRTCATQILINYTFYGTVYIPVYSGVSRISARGVLKFRSDTKSVCVWGGGGGGVNEF